MSGFTRRHVSLLALAHGLCALSAGTAIAQTTSADNPPAAQPNSVAQQPAAQADTSSAAQVGDIVITAQKRSERLQKVPITVSAFDQKTQIAFGIRDTRDVQILVPGLVFNRNLTAGIPIIRGISHNIGTIGDESPVATYVDGVYVPNNIGSLFALNNIERVEVLKGPQGTLFGRNATAGVIQIITKTPQHKFGGDASVGYGNYDTATANLYLTGGLSNTVAADLAAYVSNQGKGWGRNVTLNIPIFKSSDVSVRSKVLWQPGADTDITLTGAYNRNTGWQGSTFGILPGALGVDRATRYISRYDSAVDIPTENKNRTANGSLTIKHDFGGIEATNILAYQNTDSRQGFVQNGVAGAACAGCQAVNVIIHQTGDTWSDEFQLSYRSASGINLIGGVFALNDISQYDHDLFGQFGLGITPQHLRGRQKTESLAGFVQGTFPLGQATRLTLGGRYTTDKRTFSGSVTPLPGFPNSVTAFPPSVVTSVSPTLPPSKRWSKPTWRVSLDHDLAKDVLVFASYNRGFKSGAYAISNLSNPPVAPETLDAYEAGIKSTLFNHALRLNASLFYYQYQNIQLRSVDPRFPGSVFLFNAARGTSKGLDVDAEIVPVQNFKIIGGFEILNAHYTKFPSAPEAIPNATGGVLTGGNHTIFIDASGYTMIRAPKFTSSLAAVWTIPTSSGDFALDANWHYNSGFFWEVSNRTRQPAYSVVNASASWTSPDKRIDARIWARNLLNKFYYANVAEGQSDVYTPEAPRTYGVTVGYHF
jgi:iron complex outermembrane recepter protein